MLNIKVEIPIAIHGLVFPFNKHPKTMPLNNISSAIGCSNPKVIVQSRVFCVMEVNAFSNKFGIYMYVPKTESNTKIEIAIIGQYKAIFIGHFFR